MMRANILDECWGYAGHCIVLALPWPPSVNRLYRTPSSGPLRGRVLLSKAARQYKDNARIIIETLELTPLAGRVSVEMVAYPPDNRRRDLDNLIKIILDSLKGAAFADDSQVDQLHIKRGPVEPGGIIRIGITPAAWHENQPVGIFDVEQEAASEPIDIGWTP